MKASMHSFLLTSRRLAGSSRLLPPPAPRCRQPPSSARLLRRNGSSSSSSPGGNGSSSSGSPGGDRRSVASTANASRGPVTWGGLVVSTVVAGAVVTYYQMEKERLQTLVTTKQTTVGKPSLGGPWTLVDTNGKPVTDASYRGKFLLLYFGFTRCPDICPSELVKVGSVLDQLGDGIAGGSMKTLFISIDPQRDTLQQLRAYAADFHPAIEYLTGTKDQVKEATKAYRVYYIKADENDQDDEDYLVDHTTVMYLVSPTGEFLEFFTSSVTAAEIAKRIKGHIHAGGGGGSEGDSIGVLDLVKQQLANVGKYFRA